MNQKTQSILDKFIKGESLSASELRELRDMFSDNIHREDINQWLTNNWNNAQFDDLELSYDNLRQKIRDYETQQKFGSAFYHRIINTSHSYRRIAAVLFAFLLLGISIFYTYNALNKEKYYVVEAPLGQKAKIKLPDGSTVWLNSGSSIKYSSNFDKRSREVELVGEAFFEVKKNINKKFIVHAPFLDVEVTGTQFNVNAYKDEPSVETALVEGKVNVILRKQDERHSLTPGKIISYSKDSKRISYSSFNEESTVSWKENRLIFINDDFPKLVRKIEKWYNMQVIFNPQEYENNKLTVRLLEGEQLDQLLKIIEVAVDSKCMVKGNKIYITKN
ncbi:MAG: FecR family protein [Bacteroidota bacterium]|nr:FecR family protein [Bacteroidota bacterium]